MRNYQAQDVYLNMQVNTATPGELTLLLYNGCLKFMNLALEAIRQHNYEAKNINIKKSQNIIQELMITLDFKYDISKNLQSLYVYILEKLTEANVKLNENSLTEAIDLIKELRDTWAEAIKQLKTAKVASK